MYAFNATTGAKVWSFATGNTVTGAAVANGVVYLMSLDDNIYALKEKSGSLLWKTYLGYGNATYIKPTVANGVVYISANDSLVLLNAKTGETITYYLAPDGGQIASPPVVVNGTIYIGTYYAYLYAFHLAGH